MNYVAYTIGPIYETIFNTLNEKNKTKKLKAGSYYFSFFMKTLLKNIKNELDVLVPYITDDILKNDYKGMGLFHDRFIAQSEKSKENIQAILDAGITKTYKEIAQTIKNESIAFELEQNMSNHSIVATEEELKSVDENIIFALNKILDSKELQKELSFNRPKNNWIEKYQEKVLEKHESVKTIENISEDLGFKYYCVVTADGDKMGAKIKDKATQSPENIKELSLSLFNFFTQENNIYAITHEDFGGELIYAGGDDVLAFLPVIHKGKTFLDYLEVLNTRFKTYVGEDVSLSFGVNIAYYKYPLRNAINTTFDLLHEAKSDALIKNRLSIKVTKHSGQWFSSTMALGNPRFKLYKTLLDKVLLHKAPKESQDISDDSVTLPHSLHHSLKRYEEAILATCKNPDGSTQVMFEQVFNDTKSNQESHGLKLVQEYLDLCKPTSNKEFDEVFSQLSIIKFMRGDR